MALPSPLCPKCSNAVKENDVICLQCGCSLKNLQGLPLRSPKLGTYKTQKKNTTSASPRTVSPKFVSGLKNTCLFLLSFIIFVTSSLFAWTYFQNFSGFFRLSDELLMRGQKNVCDKFLSGLEALALNVNKEEARFYRQQLQKELAAVGSPQDNDLDNTVGMHVLDHYVDSLGLHVLLSVKNKTPFQKVIKNRQFYLKTEQGLFFADFPTSNENIGPFKLDAKKMATGGLIFRGVKNLLKKTSLSMKKSCSMMGRNMLQVLCIWI